MARKSRFALQAEFRAKDKITPFMDRLQKKTGRFSNQTSRSFSRVNRGLGNMKNLLRGTVAILTGGLIAKGIKGIVDSASMIENAVADFTPLMGGMEKAGELVDRLNKEAASTPFQFEGIASVAKQLLPVMNGSIEDTANTFRMLGDTAGGNMQKLESITRGYTKAMLKGKPDMEALNMIAEAGVPIFTEMADTMGISVDQLFELSKQGELTTDNLTDTFKRMTSKGGIYFEGMQIASETLTGRLSTLKDNIKLTAASLGQALLPLLKKGVERLIDFVKRIKDWIEANKGLLRQRIERFFSNLKEFFVSVKPALKVFWRILKGVFKVFKALAPILPVVVGALVAYKLAMKGIAAFNIVKSIFQMVAALGAQTAATGAATGAQWSLNAALNANPIGVIIMAIAALTAATIMLVKHWDKVVDYLTGKWRAMHDALIINAMFFKNVFINAWNAIKKAGGTVAHFFVNIFQKVVDFVLKAVQKIIETFGGSAEKIKDMRENVAGWGEDLQKLADTEVHTTTTGILQQTIDDANAKLAEQAGRRAIWDDTRDMNRYVRGLNKAGFDPQSMVSADTAMPISPYAYAPSPEEVRQRGGEANLNINFQNMPPSTAVEVSGAIPGMNLNTGYGEGSLY